MIDFVNPDVYDIRFIRPSLRTPLGRIYPPVRKIIVGPLQFRFTRFPICKVKGNHGDHYLKGRSELLVFKDGKSVFLSRNKAEVCCMNHHAGMKYAVPGGGWDVDEKHFMTAYREAREEALILAGNIRYATCYIEISEPRDSALKYVRPKHWWYGYYTEVFIADYDRPYSGHIHWQDTDERIRSGHFYPIDEVYSRLHPAHQKAVDEYRAGLNRVSVPSAPGVSH